MDTSFLLPDVVRAARDGYSTKFLSAVQFGSVRPFAGHHVWAEVPRKLAEKGVGMGASSGVAEAIWWNEYVPYIWFVDVDGLPVPLLDIFIRDESDAPTVALAGLLGPVVVTAPDNDLRDIGVAAPDWIATVEAGFALSVASRSAWAGLFTLRASGYGLRSAGRAAARAARTPVGQILLAAMILGLFLSRSRWLPSARRWLETVGQSSKGLAETFTPVVEGLVDGYRTADESWRNALFQAQDEGDLQRIARLLASSPHALNRTQMIRQLYPGVTEAKRRKLTKDLTDLLEKHPAFVAVNSRDWHLGRCGLDFGGQPREDAVLQPRSASLRTSRGSVVGRDG